MQTQFRVTGVRAFNQTIEGTLHDFTKVVVETKFPKAKGETQLGKTTAEYRIGDHKVLELFKNKTFPLIVEAEVELTTKGPELGEFKILGPSK